MKFKKLSVTFFVFTMITSFAEARRGVLSPPKANFCSEALINNTASWTELDLWKSDIAKLLAVPAEKIDYKQFDFLYTKVQELEEGSKAKLLEKIHEIYRDNTYNKYRNYEFSKFKRVLDLLLSRTLRADLIFEAELKKGRQPLDILQDYIQLNQEITGVAKSYNVNDVFSFFQWVQKRLAEEGRTSDYDANNWRIVFYGSYPNGRAILPHSDFDTLAELKSQERFLYRISQDYVFKRYNLDHISSNSSDKFTIRNAAQINPILFVVSKDRIEMQIYPPMSESELKTQSPRKIEPRLIVF